MDSRIYMLVHKELTGEMTPSEQAELHKLRNDKEGIDLSQDVSLIWNMSKDYFPRQDWNKGSAKAQFLNKIRTENTVTPAPQTSTVSQSNTSSLLRIGALIALLAALSYVAFTYGPSLFSSEKETIEIQTTDKIEYAVLDDNTQIWLGKESTISEVILADNKRSLKLEGEALLDVSHDAERPFFISLGNGVNIEVLGTSFKAMSANEEGTGYVTVRDGRVRLYSSIGEKNNVVVEAGQTGVLNASTEYVNSYATESVVSLGDIQALSLKDLPLKEAFKKLGDHFGVKFITDGASTEECNFNSTLVGEQSLEDIIASLSGTYPNLKISVDDRSTYTVSGTCG